MPVDGGVSLAYFLLLITKSDYPSQTTAGRADRPALKADTLAEATTGVKN